MGTCSHLPSTDSYIRDTTGENRLVIDWVLLIYLSLSARASSLGWEEQVFDSTYANS